MTLRTAGFTLLELMAALVVVGLLVGIALPTYRGHVESMKVRQAVSDLMEIASALERFRTANRFAMPESLDEIPGVPRKDPWGRDYEYLNFGSPAPGVNGKIRKDHNLHPLNSEFDLYSVGADGQSVSPLTAKASQDDIIWARNGSFVGLASEF